MPFLCGAYATRTLIGCIVCLYSTRATAVAINRYLPTTDCSRQDIKSAATNAERAEAARKKPGKICDGETPCAAITHTVKRRHRIYGHDTIAILWVITWQNVWS